VSDSTKDLSLVALVGAPNSGKTTLYNWLTNSKFRTVNYPGATVEYSIGQSDRRFPTQFMAMDTPGTYSLFPKSADEEVTLKALYEFHSFGQVSKVVMVIDGTQLERHLFVAEQMRAAGFSFLIVITMTDLLRKNGVELKKEFLEKHFQCPVVLFDGIRSTGLYEIVERIRHLPEANGKQLEEWTQTKIHDIQQALQGLVEKTIGNHGKAYSLYDQTARIDRVLLHPVWGLFLFFVIMALLFSSIFWLASPFMEGIDQFFTWAGEVVKEKTADSLWGDFLSDGVLTSFGSVLVFVPQIFVLFFGIGILEATGYLARAATLIDRPFSKIGMSGRSFVPLLSGFACAVPALMATRNIPTRRDRLITNFVIPLMTCSARLPVYALLLAFLFHEAAPWKAGLALAALYLGSLFVGAFAAGILNKILENNERGFFMMELPLYRKPRLKVLLSQSLSRTKSYVFKAGPMIFLFAVLIWGGTTFPNYQIKDSAERLQTSYLAKVGQYLEPVFTPMGGDWRVGVGLLSAFAAREVFVSSLAIVMNISDANEETQSESLLKSMSEATNLAGQKVFTTSSVIGLIVFFMIALQCMTTFAISIKENGSLGYAIVQLVALNFGAYLLAIGIVQGLRVLGIR